MPTKPAHIYQQPAGPQPRRGDPRPAPGRGPRGGAGLGRPEVTAPGGTAGARPARPEPLSVGERWRRAPLWSKLLAALALLVAAVVLFFLYVFQWNWLRGPLAHEMSARLHRPVAITGDLKAHIWSWSPRAEVNGLVVGNPAWAGKEPMARLPRLTVSVHLPDLLRGKTVLPLVEADRPDVRLQRAADGRANWNFANDKVAQPLRLPAIRHFVIADGQLRLNDEQRKLVFVGTVSSNEQVVGAGRGTFVLDGKGTLNAAPFNAHVTGGPLLNVDPNRPYPFNAQVSAGATRVLAVGTIPHPFDLSRFSSQLKLSGNDLAELYRLTGLALPATPPYALSGGFARVDSQYAFRRFSGRVGDSDLGGDATVDIATGRPFLKADLVSRRLNLADLGALIGAAPRDVRHHTVSPAQAAMAAKLKAEHRILPDAKLDLDRVRGMDARVSYRAQTVQAKGLPIRQVSLKVNLDHGLLTVDPLAFTLPQGQIAGLIRIDARKATPAEAIDIRLTGARLEQLVQAGANPPIEGTILARAKLSGVGDSVRSAAASSDGVVTVVVPHAQLRQAFAELLGINATKGLLLLLSHNQDQTPVRCAVADFHTQNGLMTADRIVLDTGVVLAQGRGAVNLRDETLDLRLDGKSKKFRLVRLAAPITVKGRLEAPQVGVDAGKAAGQLTLAGALGAFVNPLAAILPFVDLGLAKDADCSALLSQAHVDGAPVTRAQQAQAPHGKAKLAPAH
ncbi:AsmA family protein [Caulobacter sp. KR2-114]|uniref:AsmA family protein n=1 Tax=Caulobacter sp. KR2-114 TaxID=3400912 RepID=UPI003C114273